MSRRNKPKALNFVPVVRGENRLTVLALKGGDYEMSLIGAIGESFYDGSGITHKEFKNALDAIPEGSKIRLNVNSEGGSVKDGLGIYSEIESRSEDITAKVTGYALSIASIFPLAAGKVISPKSAIWMIHNAWCMNQGNADGMRACADMLEAHDETLVDIYCEHTGKTKTEIRDAMERETWIKGSNAVDFGLADESEEIEEDEAEAYRPLSEKYLNRCKNISPAILNCLRPPSAAQNGGQQPTPPKDIYTMNKKLIVALLKKHGIEASETETEEQLNAKLEKIPVGIATPATTSTATTAPINAPATVVIDLAAEVAALKRARIEDKVKSYVGQQKITNAEVKVWVNQALQDEAGTFAILDAKEATEVGGQPIGFNRIEPGTAATVKGYQGRPTDMIANMYKECTTPEARWEGFKSEFPRLYEDCRAKDKRMGQVFNENSFAAGITTNFLIVGAITKLGPKVPMFRAFTKDNSIDPYKPLASGIQKFNVTVQDGSDTQTNATDFTASSDSTLNAVTITVAQYTQGLHLSNSQLNSGIRMADLIDAKLGSFRSKLAQVVTAPITATNFGGQTPLVQSSVAFGFSDTAALLGQLQKAPVKNLILAGPYIARLSNTPGFFQKTGLLKDGMENEWEAFGWDMVCLNTEWQAADPNVQGFACYPTAIGIVTGLPLNPPEGIPGNIIQTGKAELAGPNIAVATYLWMDANTRTLRATYDIMLGATAVDTTAGIIIRSQ